MIIDKTREALSTRNDKQIKREFIFKPAFLGSDQMQTVSEEPKENPKAEPEVNKEAPKSKISDKTILLKKSGRPKK
jgi:hypothetical protein